MFHNVIKKKKNRAKYFLYRKFVPNHTKLLDEAVMSTLSRQALDRSVTPQYSSLCGNSYLSLVELASYGDQCVCVWPYLRLSSRSGNCCCCFIIVFILLSDNKDWLAGLWCRWDVSTASCVNECVVRGLHRCFCSSGVSL